MTCCIWIEPEMWLQTSNMMFYVSVWVECIWPEKKRLNYLNYVWAVGVVHALTLYIECYTLEGGRKKRLLEFKGNPTIWLYICKIKSQNSLHIQQNRCVEWSTVPFFAGHRPPPPPPPKKKKSFRSKFEVSVWSTDTALDDIACLITW